MSMMQPTIIPSLPPFLQLLLELAGEELVRGEEVEPEGGTEGGGDATWVFCTQELEMEGID
jgi:hypothetical protein